MELSRRLDDQTIRTLLDRRDPAASMAYLYGLL